MAMPTMPRGGEGWSAPGLTAERITLDPTKGSRPLCSRLVLEPTLTVTPFERSPSNAHLR